MYDHNIRPKLLLIAMIFIEYIGDIRNWLYNKLRFVSDSVRMQRIGQNDAYHLPKKIKITILL